jgi:hypothetical protein
MLRHADRTDASLNGLPMTTPTDGNYPHAPAKPSALKEEGIEYGFIGKLQELKYD